MYVAYAYAQHAHINQKTLSIRLQFYYRKKNNFGDSATCQKKLWRLSLRPQMNLKNTNLFSLSSHKNVWKRMLRTHSRNFLKHIFTMGGKCKCLGWKMHLLNFLTIDLRIVKNSFSKMSWAPLKKGICNCFGFKVL